ncbi:hypothetical protein HDU98_000305 [Podochytrium sp. JEL0797]|nr:hypothetical protein HDU98_000305 [Podochytrium sp. JEL0797]
MVSPPPAPTTATLRLTKYIDVDGIEQATLITVSLDVPLLQAIFSFVHPKQVHKLRRLSKVFNSFIMEEEFAVKCLANFLPLAKASAGDDMAELKQQLDALAITSKRSSLRYTKPNEFQELFFVWPEVYQRVFAQRFFKNAKSLGKVIGLGPRRALTIPQQISELSCLVTLDLGMCGISGVIPDAIAGLVSLEVLDLGRNRLQGVIPNGIGKLLRLRVVDLQDNELEGEIPAELGCLTELTVLLLNENQISGDIPAALGNLAKLTRLDLSKNSLTGPIPRELLSLSLSELKLNNNALTGSIPSEIGNLTSARSIHLSKNALTGAIPAEVGALVNLRTFTANSNQLSGALPESMNMISEAIITPTALGIGPDASGHEQGSKAPPPELDLDVLLEILSWIYPRKALIFRRLSKQTNHSLMTKHFARKNLVRFVPRKSCPESLGHNARDFDLMLFHWPTSYQLAYVQLFKAHITHFWWGENSVRTGALPHGKALSIMSHLVYLNLGMGRLRGVIPLEITTITSLSSLDLGYNQLEGPIPESIGNLVNLRFLKLNGNNLTGPIPTGICQLVNLFELMLSKNRLSGCIPKDIGNLVNLRELLLRENAFSGEIPPSIGSLVKLTDLYLQNCHFSGRIPKEMGNLTQLTDLHLQNNQFSGPIPLELRNLRRLVVGDLRFNMGLSWDEGVSLPKLLL